MLEEKVSDGGAEVGEERGCCVSVEAVMSSSSSASESSSEP